METSAVVTTSQILKPIVKPSELIEAHKEVSQLIQQALDKDTDYGVIPGTGKKPTLLKPGAERLIKAFGCVAKYTLVSSEVDHDREVTWKKYGKSGTSFGLYRYVYKCQITTMDNRIVGDGDGSCSTMESKYVDRPRDLENTVLKMAQKRALVAATLNAFGLSDRFTQDMEEVVESPDAKTASTAAADGYYQGREDQEKRLSEYLTKKDIAPEKQRIIKARMMNRHSSELEEIIAEVVKS